LISCQQIFIEPPPPGTEIRSNLADATEVYDAASYTVTYANQVAGVEVLAETWWVE